MKYIADLINFLFLIIADGEITNKHRLFQSTPRIKTLNQILPENVGLPPSLLKVSRKTQSKDGGVKLDTCMRCGGTYFASSIWLEKNFLHIEEGTPLIR